MLRYNGLSPEWYFVLLAALFVGFVWFTVGIWLQYSSQKYPAMYSIHFYLVGLGFIFLGNPVVVNIRSDEPLSIFLIVVGYIAFVTSCVSLFIWIYYAPYLPDTDPFVNSDY